MYARHSCILCEWGAWLEIARDKQTGAHFVVCPKCSTGWPSPSCANLNLSPIFAERNSYDLIDCDDQTLAWPDYAYSFCPECNVPIQAGKCPSCGSKQIILHHSELMACSHWCGNGLCDHHCGWGGQFKDGELVCECGALTDLGNLVYEKIWREHDLWDSWEQEKLR